MLEDIVNFISQKLIKDLGGKLESIYLVGSYTQGNVSLSRPDINWLLIWKESASAEDIWALGEILTATIDEFSNSYIIRPEFRPFKFSNPIKRGGKDMFINISNVVSANTLEEFKKKNSFIPEYVFLGFKESRKLVFGNDLLKNFEFQISQESLRTNAMQKIISHKIQLDRVPLVYHLEKDVDLLFNESLSHGKNLLYFIIELLMSDEDLKQKKFMEIYKDENKIKSFFATYKPDLSNIVATVLESKNKYGEWKNNKSRAKEVYLSSSELADAAFKELR